MKTICLQESSHIQFQIRQIGAGGNGGYFFRNLLQLISSYQANDSKTKDRFDVLIADGDLVEKKNLKNQLFSEEDISDKKVIALSDRYGGHYDVETKRVTEYITTTDMLRRLFPTVTNGRQVIPVLVGMIDNDRTRQLFDEFFFSEEVTDLVWIDLGIEGMTTFDDPNQEQLKIMNESGFGGQCVIGLKWKGSVILPPVTRVYPNILDNDRTSFPGQSCGELLPENPQRIMTNQFAAQVASMVMNNLFHTKSIYANVINFNAQFGQMKATFLSADQVGEFEKARGLVTAGGEKE
ncbi:ThiF family adenylyltransferase [Paenibacillus abyssi]|uniref:THIF-type NAD/FAD binding fold domain-containing protein n=1 Tax=Paenibacillus abyssi TaxID=1340531 RepID=A0A917G228_9BACL|nr:ThiF family adenylyltransferase [Paenibacillus abyssi]GGG18280.1 hypothetical protein GCM10010916_38890 [Paenibacillus abyssi]